MLAGSKSHDHWEFIGIFAGFHRAVVPHMGYFLESFKKYLDFWALSLVLLKRGKHRKEAIWGNPYFS